MKTGLAVEWRIWANSYWQSASVFDGVKKKNVVAYYRPFEQKKNEILWVCSGIYFGNGLSALDESSQYILWNKSQATESHVFLHFVLKTYRIVDEAESATNVAAQPVQTGHFLPVKLTLSAAERHSPACCVGGCLRCGFTRMTTQARGQNHRTLRRQENINFPHFWKSYVILPVVYCKLNVFLRDG